MSGLTPCSHLFCHQGATSARPSQVPLSPVRYQATQLCLNALDGSWCRTGAHASVCIASSIASPHRVTLLVTIRDREPSLVTLGPDTGSLGVRLWRDGASALLPVCKHDHYDNYHHAEPPYSRHNTGIIWSPAPGKLSHYDRQCLLWRGLETICETPQLSLITINGQ